MDVGVVGVWFIVIALLIVVIVSVTTSTTKYRSTVSTIIPQDQGTCRVAFDTLPSVAGLPCCFVGESLTAGRYLSELNMVVDPVAKSYHAVCSEFCTQGINAKGTQCNGSVGQQDFEKCLSISRPRNCKGPSMPVAVDGTTYYYPSSAGNTSCQDRRPCV